MKAKIQVPFFEIGVKNYIYGDQVLELAKVADSCAQKYDIDVLFIAPYTEIRRVADNTQRLIVLAPYMDTLKPGRGMADVLPEAIKAAGAKGVVINHCERPMSLSAITHTIERARQLDLLSFVCVDTIAEARAIAQLHPDIMNPEPTELIGTNRTCDRAYIEEVSNAIWSISPQTLVEVAAGISAGYQVYDLIYSGSQAAGAASGIVTAPDPFAMAEEMISNVRFAYDARQKERKNRNEDLQRIPVCDI